MDLEIYYSDRTLYVCVVGRFVLDDCEAFKDTIGPLFEKEVSQAAVDLSQTDFIDSAGLGVLVGLKIRANKGGFKFALVDPSPIVNDILTVSKLSNIFDILTGVDAKSLAADVVKPEHRARTTPDASPTAPADDGRARIEEHSRMATEAVQAGDIEGAIGHYQKVIDLDASNLAAHNNIAVLFEKRPEWKLRALSQWEHVLTLSRSQGDMEHFERAQQHITSLKGE